MTLTMRADVWDKWWKALESGHYKQGAGALHIRGRTYPGEYEQPDRYCCLGVLCALAEEAGGAAIEEEHHGNEVMYDGETAYLPQSVVAWAGLRYEGERAYTDAKIEEPRGIISHGATSREQGLSLAVLNDQMVPFAQIAKVIKEKIKPY